jgi:hypothetical protein
MSTLSVPPLTEEAIFWSLEQPTCPSCGATWEAIPDSTVIERDHATNCAVMHALNQS